MPTGRRVCAALGDLARNDVSAPSRVGVDTSNEANESASPVARSSEIPADPRGALAAGGVEVSRTRVDNLAFFPTDEDPSRVAALATSSSDSRSPEGLDDTSPAAGRSLSADTAWAVE